MRTLVVVFGLVILAGCGLFDSDLDLTGEWSGAFFWEGQVSLEIDLEHEVSTGALEGTFDAVAGIAGRETAFTGGLTGELAEDGSTVTMSLWLTTDERDRILYDAVVIDDDTIEGTVSAPGTDDSTPLTLVRGMHGR